MQNNEKNYSLYVNDLPKELNIDVEEDSTYRLNIASLANIEDEVNIIVNVHDNATFIGAMADFAPNSLRFNLTVNLLGEGSKADWHLATLSSKNVKKTYITSVNHISTHTEALVSNYGIATEESKIVFTGISAVKENAIKTNTRQEAKIIVFDQNASGLASPDLEISNNDVIASHAAVVRKLNEEHLFYLESRGLSENEAKRLIALGYLKPVEDYFTDKETIGIIDSIIEGGI